jgi:hypothetical protein
MRIGTVVVGVFLLLAAAPQAPAQAPAAPDRDQVERLASLCKLWGTVRYLHPYLPSRDIDWDAALLKALPGVQSARNGDEYAAGVGTMLKSLDDPATHLLPTTPAARPNLGKPAKQLITWVNDRTVAVDLGDSGRIPSSEYPRLRRELEKASGVILDLRRSQGWDHVLGTAGFNELLPTREAQGPAYRFVVHSGYTPQSGGSSGGYSSVFQTHVRSTFRPTTERSARKTVFLLSERSGVPQLAWALQQSGDVLPAGPAPQREGREVRGRVPAPPGERRPRPGWLVHVPAADHGHGPAEVPG